jgi:ferric-dicitrate binding protein FerR (iron transport regulator)
VALACRQARRLSLVTVAGHAREAERLELEAHLGFCAKCSDEHAALSIVRRLREVGVEAARAVDRDRVRRALAASEARVAASPRRALWPFGAAAAAVAAATIGAFLIFGQPKDRILGGDVVASPAAGSAQATTELAGTTSFSSMTGGQIRVGRAIAELAAGGTDVRWSPRERTLTLVKGAVTVDVEHQVPQIGGHFRVRTPRFTVEVVGTRFTVDLAGVRTYRGIVRVLRSDGTLVARLEAGQAWRDDSLPPLAEGALRPDGVAAGDPTPGAGKGGASVAITTRAAAVPTPARAASSPNAKGDEAGGANGSLGDRLTRGRRFLSRGDATGARRMVLPLFRQSRDLAVEARVLFAESFLVEGRYADAVDAYRVVARDFPRAEQAETSLFAIAQLQSEHGSASEARAALRTYIGRYPRGRFVHEASERLNRLSPLD